MAEKAEDQAELEVQNEVKRTETDSHGACGDDTSKELRQTEAGNQHSNDNSNAMAGSSHVSGETASLEELCSILRQQIHTSDWLEQNTGDKWIKENPELAKEYMAAAKKS